VWFLIAVLAAAFIQPFFIIAAFRTQERVVILDENGTYHMSPLLNFEDATKLQTSQTLLACLALLEENPNGLDYPELQFDLVPYPKLETNRQRIRYTRGLAFFREMFPEAHDGIPEFRPISSAGEHVRPTPAAEARAREPYVSTVPVAPVYRPEKLAIEQEGKLGFFSHGVFIEGGGTYVDGPF
jgi:hypothetical protein